MNNEPVAWINEHGEISIEEHWAYPTPLYTHPHPDNLGLAESIIKQQQAEIEALKEKLDEAIDAEKDRRFE